MSKFYKVSLCVLIIVVVFATICLFFTKNTDEETSSSSISSTQSSESPTQPLPPITTEPTTIKATENQTDPSTILTKNNDNDSKNKKENKNEGKIKDTKETETEVSGIIIEEEKGTKPKKENSNSQNVNSSAPKTDNILFIGNSLVEGIRLCTQTNNDFLSVTGISLEGLKSDIYSQIPNYSCDTVIIGMGTNELGSYTESQFKKSYTDLINRIRSVNANARIICMSIPPITANRSSADALFNNNNVKKYNVYIKEISAENNTLYLDNTPFFGEVLNSSWSGDGIHLIGSIYAKWYNFIRNNI